MSSPAEPQLTITIRPRGTCHFCRAEFSTRYWLEKEYYHLTYRQALHEFLPEILRWMDELFATYIQYDMDR